MNANSTTKKSNIIRRFQSLIFYCGLTPEQFKLIRINMANKNETVVYSTALITILLGTALFFANIASNSLAIFPCLFMILSGTIIGLTSFIPKKKKSFITFLCYSMLICLLVASAITSYLPNNRGYPATTFVAFLALVPLLIEDSPIKMMGLEIGSGMVYLSFSKIFKETAAYKLDITNTVTFVLIGIFLYIVVMKRTASELWQTIHGKTLQDSVITTVGTVIEARDGVTGEHVIHTSKIVRLIVDEMRKEKEYKNLSEEYLDNICRASALHDIGKMRIPDEILNKPGKLTSEEYEIMKKHTIYGAEIIERVSENTDDKTFSNVIYNIVKFHHERWDGKGYPEGIKGQDIPLEARIMAVADVYDALISERPYKKAIGKKEAIEIVKEENGSHFDPDIVRIFLIVEQPLVLS